MAVYVIFRAQSLDSGYRAIIRNLLRGQATMYTNKTQFGLGSGGATFRKMLVDLETMKILAVDPASAWAKGVSLNEMIQTCKKLDSAEN